MLIILKSITGLNIVLIKMQSFVFHLDFSILIVLTLVKLIMHLQLKAFEIEPMQLNCCININYLKLI